MTLGPSPRVSKKKSQHPQFECAHNWTRADWWWGPVLNCKCKKVMQHQNVVGIFDTGVSTLNSACLTKKVVNLTYFGVE